MKEKRYMKIKWNKKSITIIGSFLVILVLLIYKFTFKTKSTYTVSNGYVEKTSNTNAIVIKEEKTLELKNDISLVPIIEQGKRVKKGEVIVTYKSDNYEQYLKEIKKLDSDIQTLVKDLPLTFSVDVANIDNQIDLLTKEASGINSYLKMQEYKAKIDELAYKKVIILGQLSPAGSKIRELIETRKNLEEKNKMSNDNIKAPTPGVITYKIDGLENISDLNDIEKYTTKEIDDIYEKYKENKDNDFGIKIINNFLAYLIVKIPNNEDNEYIKEKYKYIIKSTEKDGNFFTGKLIKVINSDKYKYLTFEITDNIEKLIDSRIINVEIIWKRTDGIAVLKDAIKKNVEKNYDYVTLVTGGEYVQVPVKIISSNDGICIVDNYSKEEKEKLEIKNNNYNISLYDIILLE